jgi:hypothetical protein
MSDQPHGPAGLPHGLDDWASFLGHSVQIGSGAHAASYPMGTGGSLPGDKVPGA